MSQSLLPGLFTLDARVMNQIMTLDGWIATMKLIVTAWEESTEEYRIAEREKYAENLHHFLPKPEEASQGGDFFVTVHKMPEIQTTTPEPSGDDISDELF